MCVYMYIYTSTWHIQFKCIHIYYFVNYKICEKTFVRKVNKLNGRSMKIEWNLV